LEYTVILHPAEEGGYWGEVPALEGCFSQGQTVEETISNIREAIESHLIALIEDGKQAPKDQTMVFSHIEI
jgi:predicted RNase H-like HicB family nuclease